jgi:hypothetical protein
VPERYHELVTQIRAAANCSRSQHTERLTHIFAEHGTYGTWHAHASVGCLHMRRCSIKQELEVKKMRAIAEEAFRDGPRIPGLAFGRA